MALVTITSSRYPAHVHKTAKTPIGAVVELDTLVQPGETLETHISTDHVLTIVETGPDYVAEPVDEAPAADQSADAPPWNTDAQETLPDLTPAPAADPFEPTQI